MGRKSTIRKLSPELRKEIDRLLLDDRLTHGQIVEHMQKLGAQVSESAVYRYNVLFQDIARDIRMTREMALAVGRELDAVPDGTGRLVVDSLHALLLKARMQIAPDKAVDMAVVKQMASTAKDLAVAMKASVDTDEKVFERAKKRVASSTVSRLTERGMSRELIESIRADILGAPFRPATDERAGEPL